MFEKLVRGLLREGEGVTSGFQILQLKTKHGAKAMSRYIIVNHWHATIHLVSMVGGESVGHHSTLIFLN